MLRLAHPVEGELSAYKKHRLVLAYHLCAGRVALRRRCHAAEPAHEDERLLYAFRFDGFRIGDVLISLHEGDTGYRSELRGLARGISRIFGDFRADLSGEGQIGDGSPVPLRPDEFRRAWSYGHSASTTTVAFDPATHVATAHERLFNPTNGKDIPPNRHTRVPPLVAVEKRTDVLDPMTAVIAGRDLIRRHWTDSASAETDYRLPVFDGRHRYDVMIRPGAVEDEKIGGGIRQVVPVTTRIEPIGGFEKDTATHTREGHSCIVFSADDRFIPLQVVMGNSLGTGTFTLIADCRDNPAPCDVIVEKSRISDPE